MSTTTSQVEVSATGVGRHFSRAATAAEVLLVYSSILAYIWRWQFTYPRVSMVLLAAILATHVWHRDSLRALGVTLHELGASAREILPLFLALAAPLVVFGIALSSHGLAPPWQLTLKMFSDYCLWCAFQQYLAQSYFHHRLMSLTRNRHLSSMLVALLFGGAHIPNPILVIATTLGGFIFAELFARHRNIWPIAMTQAVAGYLIATVFPVALTHNMRVGPGYFFYWTH